MDELFIKFSVAVNRTFVIDSHMISFRQLLKKAIVTGIEIDILKPFNYGFAISTYEVGAAEIYPASLSIVFRLKTKQLFHLFQFIHRIQFMPEYAG